MKGFDDDDDADDGDDGDDDKTVKETLEFFAVVYPSVSCFRFSNFFFFFNVLSLFLCATPPTKQNDNKN